MKKEHIPEDDIVDTIEVSMAHFPSNESRNLETEGRKNQAEQKFRTFLQFMWDYIFAGSVSGHDMKDQHRH